MECGNIIHWSQRIPMLFQETWRPHQSHTRLPRSFKSAHIILQKWADDKAYEKIPFDRLTLWIQVHNLPLDRMNAQNAETIEVFNGEYLYMDNSGMQNLKLTGYICIWTAIDTTKPLKPGFSLPKENSNPTRIQFKFERLSDFCYSFGHLGHSINTCNIPSVSEGVLDLRKTYGLGWELIICS